MPEFISLSSVHCDGWGVATFDHNSNESHLTRAPEIAQSSLTFQETISKTRTDGALLHLRWATSGIPVSENNTHPFISHGFSFTHNGAIYPATALDSAISQKFKSEIHGDTDSERYFYFILTQIENLGGEGILLNTSFNIKGKPILTTMRDAFEVLEQTKLNGFVHNNLYYTKEV